jgi:hypothetical protein
MEPQQYRSPTPRRQSRRHVTTLRRNSSGKKSRSRSANKHNTSIDSNFLNTSLDQSQYPDFTGSNSGEPTNPFDKKFRLSKSDPFLGQNVEFNYIPLSKPLSFGFYCLWKSTLHQAPIIVHFIGGPGRCVLNKAFGGYNPLHIDSKRSCLKINPDSAISKYNLLYIESPIGSGYSKTTSKAQIKDYSALVDAIEEVFVYLRLKHPRSKNLDVYCIGDGFCGLQLPAIAWHLKVKMALNVQGIILENPLLHPDQLSSVKIHTQHMEQNGLWKGGCEKGVCNMALGIGSGCHSIGLIPTKTWRRSCLLLPWTWRNLFKPQKKSKKHKEPTPNNFHESDSQGFLESMTTFTDATHSSRQEIFNFVDCKKFREIIGARKSLADDSDSNHVDIIKYCYKFSSCQMLSWLIQAGVNLCLITGDKDYNYPFNGVESAFSKCTFDSAQEFKNLEWTENFDGTFSKRLGNVRWVRNTNGGHFMYGDLEKWFNGLVLDIFDECEVKRMVDTSIEGISEIMSPTNEKVMGLELELGVMHGEFSGLEIEFEKTREDDILDLSDMKLGGKEYEYELGLSSPLSKSRSCKDLQGSGAKNE